MRRRPPSEPGFTARSREDVARPASGQLVSTQTEREEEREEDVEAKADIVTEVHRLIVPVWITHMQVTLHFLRLCSAPRLLQEGTSQLAHRHPSVELRGIESKRDEVPLPTQHAGRVLGTLPGGGGSEGKEVRMQEWGTWGDWRSQKNKYNVEPFSTKGCPKMCSSNPKGAMLYCF